MLLISIEEDETLAKNYYELFLEQKHIRVVNQTQPAPRYDMSLTEIMMHAFQTACGLLQSEYNNTVLHGKILNVTMCRTDQMHHCWEGPSFGLAIFAALISFALKEGLPKNAAYMGGVLSDATGQCGLLAVDGWEWKLTAAREQGITQIYYPMNNSRELNDLERKNPALFGCFQFFDIWNCKQFIDQVFPRK